MKKIGNFRIGKGAALILNSRLMVIGLGTKSFMSDLKDETGFDAGRRHLP